MSGKYSSQSINLYANGVDLTAFAIKNERNKLSSKMEDVTGLGDSFQKFLPAGMGMAEWEFNGALWDTNTGNSHDTFKAPDASPQGTPAIVTIVLAGQTKGNEFVGYQGAFLADYEPLGVVGELNKVNVRYQVTGRADFGVLLQELAAKTADFNTKTQGLEIDGGAATTTGWAAHLQVTAYSGFSSVAIKIRDSADNSTYADLTSGAFASVTAVGAQRITGAAGATVRRYTCIDCDVTGTGSITFLVGLSRLPA